MMESTLMEGIITGGPVAVLAFCIFLMYVRDRKDTEKNWRHLTEDLVRCRDDENKSREEHTKALTELTTVLRTMNGKK